MVEHWLHHNEEHARSFIDWAERARSMEQAAVAILIDDVARQSLLQNEQLRKALQLLKSASDQTA
jgi:predicted metal-binding transcription factor (methanogenesis marker protein 9)